jgi:hypothetical protein
MLKKMTIRVSKRAHRFFGAWFKSPTAGGEYLINSQPALLRQTLHEVAGQFTVEELTFFVAVLQGCHLTPELAGQHLAADVGDALALEPEAWEGYDLGDALAKRVQGLPIYARAALEIWARAYNNHPDPGNPQEYAQAQLDAAK